MANYSFFSSLLAFFITSSKLTKWGEAQKRKIDSEYKEGERRDGVLIVILYTLLFKSLGVTQII